MMFLTGNGIKIGVIGLATKLTPQISKGLLDGLFPEYEFRNYSDIVK